MLIYLDQSITARLVNSAENKLQKGAAYDLDLLIVGCLLGLCSILGLPWLVGATVRSLSHVRSLATVEVTEDRTVNITGVRENRVSALFVHLLIGASLLATSLLRQVPMAILFGLFLYMGIASMGNNQLFERLRLWLMDPSRYPSFALPAPRTTIGNPSLHCRAACLFGDAVGGQDQSCRNPVSAVYRDARPDPPVPRSVPSR